MSQIRVMYNLQQLDSEIKEKKQRLGEVLRAQKETAELQAARQRNETAVAVLKSAQAKRQNLNLELDSLNSKAKRSEDRLYSGNVKNPKELSDLQHEIEALGRRRSALEDEILEAMVLVEDAETEKVVAEKSLTAVESRWQQSTAVLRKEQQELALRLHKLMGEREKQAALLSPESRAQYDTLAKRKNGVAVAGLRGNECQACFMTVSAAKVKSAELGELVYCGSCGRVLCPV
ncbi:MAG: hypothetical protein H6659_18270 [Ardenticatenaceae bacterium]|nr:hypothetical protein [Ardenticatenaceae bacterium]MCB8988197.1 hypothetical protein [Ardenticatenaceae bacterium]